MLRRTRVGGFHLDSARTLEELEAELTVTGLGEAARASFPALDLTEDQVAQVRFGRVLAGLDLGAAGPVALFDPEGRFLALYEQRGGDARAVAVFVAG
jgi:tRNA pseudouridine55 synthase